MGGGIAHLAGEAGMADLRGAGQSGAGGVELQAQQVGRRQNGVEGDRAGEVLADQRAQIGEAGHAQGHVPGRDGGAGGEREVALGMRGLPVGAVDGDGHRAVRVTLDADVERERRIVERALRLQLTRGGGGQAGGGERRLQRSAMALDGDLASEVDLGGKIADRAFDMALRLQRAGNRRREHGEIGERHSEVGLGDTLVQAAGRLQLQAASVDGEAGQGDVLA
jgi:hypothetical protein